MVKDPSSNARDVGSIPGWGTKIPQAAGQLSMLTATTELMHSGAHERSCMMQLKLHEAK